MDISAEISDTQLEHLSRFVMDISAKTNLTFFQRI